MQVYSVDEDDSADPAPSRLARLRRTLSTAVGATIALALLLAVGGWFYRLGVRDAGNVPIIRASAEPAKTRPEDPGGVVTPHQNITSYQVAESAPVRATSAVIAPPPQAPAREDVAMGKLPPPPAERPRPANAPAARGAEPPKGPSAPPPSHATDGTARALQAGTPTAPEVAEAPPLPTDAAWTAPRIARAEMALAATTAAPDATAAPDMIGDIGITGDTRATGGTGESADAAEADDSAADPAPDAVPDPVTGGSEYAPPLSPVAPARPGDLMARMTAAERTAERSADDLVQRAANSDVQVQLAADPDEVVIRQMWERIRQANSDILHDRALAVQTTISGGTKFYRLRVGPFSGVTEARAVCQALKARGQDCIVARNG